MLVRALAAFLILPGTFAGMLPFIIMSLDRWRGAGWSGGAMLLVTGLLGLLWCVRDFYVSGKGTLAPWDPPHRLVVVGLYRYTRNPMYISVLTIVSGWAVLSGSPLLFGYLVLLGVMFHLRVLTYEERVLSQQFPDEWEAYAGNVRRWLPRPRPWSASHRSA
jgi:protein-S-isoprenylcysteine O-methyltransferase Ste14